MTDRHAACCLLCCPSGDACDVLIHERKKNKTHTREGIEIVEPEPEPVPCDSNAQHVAVMYCESVTSTDMQAC